MHVYQQIKVSGLDVPHGSTCLGSTCEECGCCIHCMDECPCHGCASHDCKCYTIQCEDQWCSECYPEEDYAPLVVQDVRLTWKQYAKRLADELSIARQWQIMMADIDRCEHGRHEGDACFGCDGGYSWGNPWVNAGEPFGFNLEGFAYVVPDREKRNDPRAWKKQLRASQ